MTSLDLFPTSATLAGLDRSEQVDGVDLMPFLSGEVVGTPHESIFWRVGNRAALRRGDWKIVRNPVRGNPGDWKLFQLKEDIAEENDLAGSEKAILKELIGVWEDFDEEMVEPAFK